MTKKEAIAEFRANHLPVLREHYSPTDRIAFRTAWNNYTDSLCKAGQITEHQYMTWIGPFK